MERLANRRLMRTKIFHQRERYYLKYEYRYTDDTGKKHSVYSWRLVATDKTPQGKNIPPPLRETEREIKRDLEDDIDSLLYCILCFLLLFGTATYAQTRLTELWQK